MLENKSFKPDKFKRMQGGDVTIEWLEEDEDAMTEPIVVEKPDGLGMKMPPSDFTVEDVAELVGEESPVEVIGLFRLPVPSSLLRRKARCRDPVGFSWLESR
jgi:F-box/leucine-rich repeat protein 10/11